MKNLFKKINIVVLFAMVFQTLIPASAFAQEEKDMWVKLGRGANNIVTGWVEVFNQPMQMAKTERWAIAIGGGVPKGIFMAVLRTLVGGFEVLTFPVKNGTLGYNGFLEPEVIIPK